MTVADNLPALPDNTDPNDPEVIVYKDECRTCGKTGPAVRDDDVNVAMTWSEQHLTTTGHHQFYLWTVTRQTTQMRPRPAGKRGRR